MNQKTTAKVYVIVLNYNGFEDTRECLRSLEKLSYTDLETAVVENGSSDGSAEKLEKIRNIRLLKSSANLGFAGGCNLGIEYALERGADFVLLLNNDTVVEPGFLDVLLRCFAKDETVGIAGSKILYDGKDKIIWSAGGGVSRYLKRTFQYGENRLDDGKFDRARDVDFVSGCCMLIRRDVLEKAGLLDPVYFMYYEDVDICLRAQQQGFRVRYCPEAVIHHRVSASTNRSFRDYYRMRNYLILLKKHFPGAPGIAVRTAAALIERLGRIVTRKIVYRDTEKQTARVKQLFLGLRDGVRYEIKNSCIK